MIHEYSLARGKQLSDMTNDIAEKRSKWMGRMLFLSATLFGILISLYGETQAILHIRLCFASACVLLALGLITLSVASYNHIVLLSQARNTLLEELQNPRENCRRDTSERTNKIKFFEICEVCAYIHILLLLSVLLLAIYVLLIAIFGS